MSKRKLEDFIDSTNCSSFNHSNKEIKVLKCVHCENSLNEMYHSLYISNDVLFRFCYECLDEGLIYFKIFPCVEHQGVCSFCLFYKGDITRHIHHANSDNYLNVCSTCNVKTEDIRYLFSFTC